MDEEFQTLVQKYEGGELSFSETVSMFQEMIETGEVWKMSQKYRDTAANLIAEGHCDERVS